MREFYQIINEYPWTTVLLAIFSLCITVAIANVIESVCHARKK